MIGTLFALWLLYIAITGYVRVAPSRLPANLLALWWLPSLFAHLLAGPMLIVAALSSVLLDGLVTKALAALAALIFALVHMRNRRDGVAMMRAMGLNRQLPFHAGLWPIPSRRGVKRISRIAYAPDGERTTLDVLVPSGKPPAGAPVLLHVHGGAWILGRRNQQGKPLMFHLVRHGWVCVDINYRLGPKNRFPAMLTDVLRAIAWTKANIAEHGGDPARIVLTGGSAGGHLAALAALAHDRPEAKPGFEDADCSTIATVPCYGRFDFIDRNHLWGRNHEAMRRFEADKVMPDGASDGLWELASPIAQVAGDAPPMLVIHGCHDTLIPVEEGAVFAKALREAGKSVDHIEISGGQHAFDVMDSAVTWGHVRAVRAWLDRRVA